MMTNTPWEIRFWSKVDKTGDCWIWTGATKNGYGILWYKGKMVGAHRLSYMAHYGHIEEGKCICHDCHNKLCVNPQHLWQGTYRENILDSLPPENPSLPYEI